MRKVVIASSGRAKNKGAGSRTNYPEFPDSSTGGQQKSYFVMLIIYWRIKFSEFYPRFLGGELSVYPAVSIVPVFLPGFHLPGYFFHTSSIQGAFQAFLNKPIFDPVYGPHANLEDLADLLVGDFFVLDLVGWQ